MIATIDGASFQRMVIHGAASINAQKQSINELNVFPVPCLLYTSIMEKPPTYNMDTTIIIGKGRRSQQEITVAENKYFLV